MNTCEKCSMDATHTWIDEDGLVHNFCVHHAPSGSVKRGEVSKPTLRARAKTYKPLIVATTVVLLYVLVRIRFGGRIGTMNIVEDLMGGYFLVFGLLQIRSGASFVATFAKYDPLGARFPLYARAYPYMLFFFGILHHIGALLVPIAIVSIVIFSIQTKGIWKVLKSGEQIKCACVGTKFALPLSYVTIVENSFMILFALATLLFTLVG